MAYFVCGNTNGIIYNMIQLKCAKANGAIVSSSPARLMLALIFVTQ